MSSLALLRYLNSQLCVLARFSEQNNIVADSTEYYMQYGIV